MFLGDPNVPVYLDFLENHLAKQGPVIRDETFRAGAIPTTAGLSKENLILPQKNEKKCVMEYLGARIEYYLGRPEEGFWVTAWLYTKLHQYHNENAANVKFIRRCFDVTNERLELRVELNKVENNRILHSEIEKLISFIELYLM